MEIHYSGLFLPSRRPLNILCSDGLFPDLIHLEYGSYEQQRSRVTHWTLSISECFQSGRHDSRQSQKGNQVRGGLVSRSASNLFPAWPFEEVKPLPPPFPPAVLS